MEITGTLALDGRPLADVELALVTDDGRTVAIARSDRAGGFSLPRAAAPAAPATSWVVAKLQAPVIGAVVADLEYVPVDVHRDTHLRVTMVPLRGR